MNVLSERGCMNSRFHPLRHSDYCTTSSNLKRLCVSPTQYFHVPMILTVHTINWLVSIETRCIRCEEETKLVLLSCT